MGEEVSDQRSEVSQREKRSDEEESVLTSDL
jgi:hypothetical protein